MKDKTKTFLSKSKYIEGLQCSKLIWCEYNSKELFPPIDPAQQAIFDEGKRVGTIAQQLFPGGIKLEREFIPEQYHAKSIAALKLGKPIFEAGFVFKRVYAIADIIVPTGEAWDLYEVKSSTNIKEEQLSDIAFQKYTYKNAGVNIGRCFLVYINNQYVRKGPIDPKKLFLIQDVTDVVEDLQEQTFNQIQTLLDVIALEKAPDTKIGPHCEAPYVCALKGICWKFLPEKDHVFILSRGKKLAFQLVEKGILNISDIPEGTKLTDKQLIQLNSHRENQSFIDKQALKDFLVKLGYPLFFLDFETIGPAIPAYDVTSPYEQVPFQYSLHVIEKEGAKPVHHSYLAPGVTDPRLSIITNLKELLGTSGSIIAYNATFEINAIRKATEVYTEFRDWFSTIEPRFVDLLEPFRGFAYYHPAQQGSGSLKHVLPALTNTSYKDLEINNGGLASSEYSRVTFNEVPETERLKVRTALEQYCQLDTKGMIDILEFLKKKTR